MASLDDETGEALARRFPYMQRKGLTMASREWRVARSVGPRYWARDSWLFDLAWTECRPLLAKWRRWPR